MKLPISRTYQRKNERHEYHRVLHEYSQGAYLPAYVPVDRHSKKGRRALARFISDAYTSMSLKSSAPRKFCKGYQRRLNEGDQRMMQRWLPDPGFDPVFNVQHRHAANYYW